LTTLIMAMVTMIMRRRTVDTRRRTVDTLRTLSQTCCRIPPTLPLPTIRPTPC
jgi:hypothetical protein